MSPTTVNGIRSFVGHTEFYKRFIRDFSKIVRPLYRLLEKDTKFNFDESCHNSFEEIKSRLVEAPIMAKPNWNKEFEIMCDASDFAMGAVLGQKAEKVFKAIYYASKTFNEAQENYSTYGGHFAGDKILQSGFYWPTVFKDCFEWVKLCDQCQRMGNISRRHEMPLQGILVVQLFDVWGLFQLHLEIYTYS